MQEEQQPKGVISYKKLFLFAAAILLILAAIYYIDDWRTPESFAPQINPEAALGEAGSVCGGSNRLPCKPGNACMVTNMETRDGVCIKISDNPGPVEPKQD